MRVQHASNWLIHPFLPKAGQSVSTLFSAGHQPEMKALPLCGDALLICHLVRETGLTRIDRLMTLEHFFIVHIEPRS